MGTTLNTYVELCHTDGTWRCITGPGQPGKDHIFESSHYHLMGILNHVRTAPVWNKLAKAGLPLNPSRDLVGLYDLLETNKARFHTPGHIDLETLVSISQTGPDPNLPQSSTHSTLKRILADWVTDLQKTLYTTPIQDWYPPKYIDMTPLSAHEQISLLTQTHTARLTFLHSEF